jgi:hypothetical protein
MARSAAIIAVAAALAATPAVAVAAQPNPFLPQQERSTQEAPPQAPAPAPAPVQETVRPIDRGTLGLIVLGVCALIGAIWFVIARDARRATQGRVRSGRGDALAASSGRGATRAPPRGRRLSSAERRRRKRGRAR